MATAARSTQHAASLFQKARRENVPLKIALFGPSGSGKTDGALALARGLVGPTGRIALVDSENGSASLYAQEHDFDTLRIAPPYTTDKYLEAIAGAVDAGYDVVILDTISHQWSGTGGILERVDKAKQRPGTNQYTVWGPFTEEHERFRAAMLQSPIHLIATLRAKQGYVLETNDRGKQAPKKVGMEPIQREGLEYEFSLVFELQMDHRGAVSKDRTKMFSRAGELVDLKEPATAARLTDWLQAGAVLTDEAPSERERAAREAAARREGTLHVEQGGQAEGEQRRPPSRGATGSEKPASGGTAASGPARTASSSNARPNSSTSSASGSNAETMTLGKALKLRLPFRQHPDYGKQLVEISTEALEQVNARLMGMDVNELTAKQALTLASIALVLDARARQAAKAAAGSGGTTAEMPNPGRVEDALTPTAEETPPLVKLADHLYTLLGNKDMPRTVADEIRGAFERGEIKTEAQLRAAIARANDALLPF